MNMAERVNPRLLSQLKKTLGIGRSALYARIEARGRERALPRDLAAISLAQDASINVFKYATSEQLAELRSATPPRTTGGAQVNAEPAARRMPRKQKGDATSTRTGNRVWVVHGRNENLRRAMFTFLRAAGVEPIEWSKALLLTRSGSPHIGEVLDAAFKKARAVVVMLTPDDEAKLHDSLIRKGDPRWEKKLTGQARPNVLFEAGMAFGTHPKQTVLVEFGKLRPISDIAGRHAVRMDDTVDKRQELMTKLQAAGCAVDWAGSDWKHEGDFTL